MFGSGSSIAFGTNSTGDTVQYGDSTNDVFTVANTNVSINGGAGTDKLVLSSSNTAPTSAWNITENAAGQIVVAGTAIGYTGTATLHP